MAMRLDHISYATSPDHLVDVVQRLGSRIGTAFTDGGIHPSFGTRNFTLPLNDGLYLEVVCPLDHPAADSSAFGKIVTQRVNQGGGWLSWAISTDSLAPIEKRLGRLAVDGHRRKPDGIELRWKQLGILGTLDDAQLPFFISWQTPNHPSQDGKASASIFKIEICGSKKAIEDWTSSDVNQLLDGIEIEWINPENYENETGIVAIHVSTLNGTVRLD